MTLLDNTATVTATDVTVYCNDVIAIINIVITKCRLIPSGHIFHDTNIIASILFGILCEINFTLQLLLTKCGLRMSLYSTPFTICVLSAYTNSTVTGLLLVIILLVGGLIAALNHLLIVVAGVCGTGLLQLLLTLILGNCGSNFLLILLGLVII